MNTQLKTLHDHGRCSQDGLHELFFSDRPADLAEAQMICVGCPVKMQCLDLAIREGQEWGVWGGVIFWDGQPFYRRRGRGRPRQNEAALPIEADLQELRELVKSA